MQQNQSETSKNTQKKPTSRTRQMTDGAWFSRLLQHPAMKWIGSTLSTPEPTHGVRAMKPTHGARAMKPTHGARAMKPTWGLK